MTMTIQAYRTITGRIFDLATLANGEREFLVKVFTLYTAQPEWSEFSFQRNKIFDEWDLEEKSSTYRICQDLEARLGIMQGKVSPPDYRDYLADLIEARYGSRYRFCKETGIDPGHLSRVLAGRSDLSLASLSSLLGALQAVLVIEPEQQLRESTSPEVARQILASLQQ